MKRQSRIFSTTLTTKTEKDDNTSEEQETIVRRPIKKKQKQIDRYDSGIDDQLSLMMAKIHCNQL